MVKPIKNNKKYEVYLGRVYTLIHKKVKLHSKEGDELEVLPILIKEYETVHFPVPKPNPIEAIRFRLEQMEMSESELSAILGHRTRKSEILLVKENLVSK